MPKNPPVGLRIESFAYATAGLKTKCKFPFSRDPDVSGERDGRALPIHRDRGLTTRLGLFSGYAILGASSSGLGWRAANTVAGDLDLLERYHRDRGARVLRRLRLG